MRHAAFTPDSTRVVYRLALPGGGSAALFAHPLDGSSPALRLHEPADTVARLTVLADAALFLEAPSASGGDALFRVPLDGARRARAVSAPLPFGRTIREFHASPDGERVAYSADADVAGVFTLFAGPLTFERVRAFGSPPPVGVRGIGGSADVARFVFTQDSSAVLAHVASAEGLALERVGLDGSARRLSGPEGASDLMLDDAGSVAMYRGAREHDSRMHVYSVPVDGSAQSRQLDDFGPVLGGVYSFEIHPEGREAIFAAGSRDWAFNELHRVPLDLSAPPRLLPGLVEGSEYLFDHRVEPLSERVVYRLRVPDPFAYALRLYSAPLDLSAPRVRLDPGELNVLEYGFAGGRVLFRKGTDPAEDNYELFSVPADASGPAQVLNGALPPNGRVEGFVVGPDGTRVVYVASQNVANRRELFSVPADGSQGNVRLNPTPPPEGDVGVLRITPDGARVVFAGDLVLNNAVSLWVAPLAGGSAAQVLWTATAGREVERLQVTSDSTRAVFTADGIVNTRHQLYVVPVDGSAPAAPLPTTAGDMKVYDFWLTPDGTRAVYLAGGRVASVPVDGSAAPVILSPPLAADRHVAGTPETTDEWVLLLADQELRGRYDLFAVPVDGSLPARRVNVPSGNSGVQGYATARDEVLFVQPSTPDYGSWQLFRAPLAGGSPPRSLNLPGTYTVTSSSPGTFQIHSDEHRVLFGAYAASSSGFTPGYRLYLGFLGQPIRGAEHP